MGFWGHLKTVLSHKWQVFLLCKKAGIWRHGITHDLSKFSPTEFLPGAKYYQGGKRSPNEQERTLFGYSKAWLHHKGRNRHHFEYWTDYNPVERKIMPIKMPLDRRALWQMAPAATSAAVMRPEKWPPPRVS